MNQRIKDIFEQACFETEYDDGQNLRETMDRFAELIVEECADFIEQDQGAGEVLSNRLKKHFGVA